MSVFSYQVEDLKMTNPWIGHLGMRAPPRGCTYMRHPDSESFEALLLGQLLDYLLNMRRSCGFTTGSQPCRGKSKENVKTHS